METLERALGRVVEEGRVALQEGGKGVGKGVGRERGVKGKGGKGGKGKGGKGRVLGLDATRFNRMGYGVEVEENGRETESETEQAETEEAEHEDNGAAGAENGARGPGPLRRGVVTLLGWVT